jgi:hypothetical protein
MEVVNTSDNASYAESVNARIKAETANVRRTNRLLGAKAALWYATGCGVVVVALGAATGVAFFGYSFISDSRASLDQLTAALTKALQTTTLHTDVTVGLKPDATVALAAGAHVTLNPGSVSLASGGTVSMQPGTVSLAPGSTVGIRSSDMPEIIRQMRQTDKTGRPAPEFDKVTAFQTRAFQNGEVGTGWNYRASNDFSVPYQQFCFYRERDNKSRTQRSFELAADGQIHEDLRNPFNIDMREAFKLCIWHP